MAQAGRGAMTNRSKTTNNYNAKGTRTSSVYAYGNTARQLNVQRQLEEEPRKQLSHETRKNREKASHMSLGYVVFLMAALATCAIVLIHYIQLQSDLTNRMRTVAKLESEVNSLKMSNDDAYTRITSSIDFEEIKRIAIGELGMTYAQEGQIITYANEGNDYMRQIMENSN